MVSLLSKWKQDSPVPFSKKHYRDKEQIILFWFVGEKHSSLQIIEQSVNVKPEAVNNVIVGDDIDTASVQIFFAYDDWKLLVNIVETKC